MLNGLAPVMVFTFTRDGALRNLIGDTLSSFVDWIPQIIPVYLDERLTEVASDNATENIKIDYAQFADTTYQKRVRQQVKISFRVRKNNTLASVILSLIQKIYETIDAKTPNDPGYFVTLYYDSTFMSEAWITDYSKTTVGNSDLYQVDITFLNSTGVSLTSFVLEKTGLIEIVER